MYNPLCGSGRQLLDVYSGIISATMEECRKKGTQKTVVLSDLKQRWLRAVREKIQKSQQSTDTATSSSNTSVVAPVMTTPITSSSSTIVAAATTATTTSTSSASISSFSSTTIDITSTTGDQKSALSSAGTTPATIPQSAGPSGAHGVEEEEEEDEFADAEVVVGSGAAENELEEVPKTTEGEGTGAEEGTGTSSAARTKASTTSTEVARMVSMPVDDPFSDSDLSEESLSDLDDNEPEVPEGNIIVGQFVKFSRSDQRGSHPDEVKDRPGQKNSVWKAKLESGVMRLGNQEYIFATCDGEFIF
eukprot:GHVS01030606.1.p1 GENE.GHVS01030606.1~~GHVS01030606.1.p1  ORF type:complete len:321 (-),score=81.72 GHVS01030606.1:78-989(-)